MQFLTTTKSHGAIIIDSKHVADTLQCVHCSSHEQIIKGSGKKRALCPQCNMGFVCGRKACMIHIPFEAKLEYMESKANNSKVLLKLEKKYPLIKRFGL